MTEAILAVVIVALLVERFFSNRTHAVEIARLNNAIIARTPAEKRMLDDVLVASRPAKREPEPSKIDGFVGQAGLS